MTAEITTSDVSLSAAERNRRLLKGAGVFTVSLLGGPGCGKSTFMERVLERVGPKARVGVVGAGSAEARPERPVRDRVYVEGGGAICLDAGGVGEALSRIDLNPLDLILIENVGTVTIPPEHLDLGQDVTVTIFSVAGGDDKARKHRDLVEAADAVVLNKIDLLPVVPFDLGAFRQDVHRANPGAELFEVSSLAGRGVNAWVEWLKRRTNKNGGSDEPSHWFG